MKCEYAQRSYGAEKDLTRKVNFHVAYTNARYRCDNESNEARQNDPEWIPVNSAIWNFQGSHADVMH